MGLRDTRSSIEIAAICLAVIMLIQPAPNRSLAGEGEGGSNLITSIPRTMSYQGILKDSGGDPVTDSVYSVTFRIFNVSAGGTSLWDETLPCTTSAGYFSTIFSNVNLPFDEDYWLELELGGDILDPRQKLNMVGYAAVADTADYAHAAPAGGSSGWADDGAVVRLETSSDRVGIGTSSPLTKLHVVADSNYGIAGTVVPTGSEEYIGVVGLVEGGSGTNTGVLGDANSGGVNRGVSGQAEGPGNENIGVFGYAADGTFNAGLFGEAHGPGDENIGVYGYAEGGDDNWAGFFNGDVGVGQNVEIQGRAAIGTTNPTSSLEIVTTDSVAAKITSNFSGQQSRGLDVEVTDAFNGVAISGISHSPSGVGGSFEGESIGLYSGSSSGTGIWVYGSNVGIHSLCSSGWAGDFDGNVNVLGWLHVAFHADIGSNNTNLGFGSLAVGSNNSAAGEASIAAGNRAKANHNNTFVWSDSTDADFASTANNQFLVRASGGTYIYSNSGLSAGVYLSAGGSSWNSVSDRAVKRNIRSVNGQEILEKLSQLPISRWSYKAQDESIEHIGPMAQDFYATFGLGEDDKHISTIDPDGVALAAIQGLYAIVQEQKAEIDELKEQLSKIQRELSVLTLNSDKKSKIDNELSYAGESRP